MTDSNVFSFMASHRAEVLQLTGEHLFMVAIALVAAVAIGVPAGIAMARHPRLARPVLGINNVVQTIPSLALLGFLLAVPWVGAGAQRTAIVALTAYALLPIIQNTYSGISEIEPSVRDAAIAMGMTSRQRLRLVELPLALGPMIGGLRIATVTTIGIATIAAAIGAGGLGEYIFRGLAMVDSNVILAGAIPAALLALLAEFGLVLLERAGSGHRSSRAQARTAANAENNL
jgi:osmoprotectant transport system permease protein